MLFSVVAKSLSPATSYIFTMITAMVSFISLGTKSLSAKWKTRIIAMKEFVSARTGPKIAGSLYSQVRVI